MVIIVCFHVSFQGPHEQVDDRFDKALLKNQPELLFPCVLVALLLHGLWISVGGGMSDIALWCLRNLMELNYLSLFDLAFMFAKKIMVLWSKVTFGPWKQFLLFYFLHLTFHKEAFSSTKDSQNKSSVFFSLTFHFFLESERSLLRENAISSNKSSLRASLIICHLFSDFCAISDTRLLASWVIKSKTWFYIFYILLLPQLIRMLV